MVLLPRPCSLSLDRVPAHHQVGGTCLPVGLPQKSELAVGKISWSHVTGACLGPDMCPRCSELLLGCWGCVWVCSVPGGRGVSPWLWTFIFSVVDVSRSDLRVTVPFPGGCFCFLLSNPWRSVPKLLLWVRSGLFPSCCAFSHQ